MANRSAGHARRTLGALAALAALAFGVQPAWAAVGITRAANFGGSPRRAPASRVGDRFIHGSPERGSKQTPQCRGRGGLRLYGLPVAEARGVAVVIPVRGTVGRGRFTSSSHDLDGSEG